MAQILPESMGKDNVMRFLLIIILTLIAGFTSDRAVVPDPEVELIGPLPRNEMMRQLGYSDPDTFVVTAYLPIDEFEHRFHGITYSGVPAIPYRSLAVDPKVVPLGTWVYIEGLGWWRSEDTGNLIKGNRLDICVTTRDEARQWGKQKRRVWYLMQNQPGESTNSENVVLASGEPANKS